MTARKSPTTPSNPSYDRLDQRVAAIESSIDNIGRAIITLGDKFDNRSRTPWAVLVSCGLLLLALIGVIGTAWKAPIDSTLMRQDYDIRQMQDDIVPRVEHDNYRAQTARERDDIKSRLDRLESRMFQSAP